MGQPDPIRPFAPAPPHILVRVMRFAFHQLYHPLAWTYDWVAWTVSIGLWKQWVYSAVPEIQGPRVLELGPGPGHLLKKLAEYPGYMPFALERSPQMRRIARRRLKKAGLKAPIVAGDALDLPFADGAFDTIVATFPAEYIANPIAWQQAARVLKPGGRFVVLLGAQVVGGGLLHRAAAALFRITGQSGSISEAVFRSRLGAVVEDTELEIRFTQKPVKQSQVFIVLAEKQPAA